MQNLSRRSLSVCLHFPYHTLASQQTNSGRFPSGSGKYSGGKLCYNNFMFNAGSLTFQEFIMRESLPLATIQETVLEFLRGRDDAVVFGAQAVNAYVPEPRMSQDIDLLSTRAAELAEELRTHLSNRFHVAIRVRKVAEGRGYRLYQIQKSGNRHLVDIRFVPTLPPSQRIAKVLVA